MTDQCCQCRPYPNGFFVLLSVQVLLVIGFSLSAYSALDCHFVVVNAAVVEPLNNLFNATQKAGNTERGLGFAFFEDANGQCTHHNDMSEDEFETYLDFLGDDWHGSQGAAVAAVVFSFVVMVWLGLFSCLSHHKIVRWLIAGWLVLTGILQACTFSVMGSDFCDDNDCDIGRSARASAVATPIFFVTALLMLFTRDYPGATVEPTSSHAQTPKVARVMDEETPTRNQFRSQQQQGLTNVEEVPVQHEFVNVALVDSNAPSPKASVY